MNTFPTVNFRANLGHVTSTQQAPRNRYTAALRQAEWDRNRSQYEPPKVTMGLRDLRNKLGIPTAEFAERLGISAPHLRYIEAGKRGISEELADKIQIAIDEYFAGNR